MSSEFHGIMECMDFESADLVWTPILATKQPSDLNLSRYLISASLDYNIYELFCGKNEITYGKVLYAL